MREIGKPLSENTKQRANAIYSILKRENGYITKEELGARVGIKDERIVREVISIIAEKVPIISKSNTHGYKLAKTENDVEEAINVWRELDSREEELKRRKKPIIAFVEKYKKDIIW